MHKLAFVALVCLGAVACSPTTSGTVGGATVGAATGAVVGGPVGAVVGGTVGAVAGSNVGASAERRQVVMASPGRCYVYDEYGRQAIDRRGRPVTTRC
jgi:outer membrane lipoprotein SlyB